MKRLIVLFTLAAMSLPAIAQSDWKGKVVDEKGEPLAYANVAILLQPDSTVVCGVTTGEDGSFSIVTKETEGIMMVSLLGYQTKYMVPVNDAVITLLEDAAMLESATVSAIMPKTKLTGEGLQTSIRGSVLENAGSAKDVLAKTPGMIKTPDGLQVIGKGSPLIYINGRKVTDSGELDRLQSNEIQSIEVISNPGAQYDATVHSVVRIRTIRRQGDGFGFNLNTSDEQSLRWNKGNDPFAALDVNYRIGGVDLFGGVNYARYSQRQTSETISDSYFNKLISRHEEGGLTGDYFEKSLYGNAGVNWQIADNHFLGGKIEWGRTLLNDISTIMYDTVFENGVKTDELRTLSVDSIGDKTPYSIGSNIYYNGLIGGKLGVDINLDYYGTDNSSRSVSEETSPITSDRHISSSSNSDSRLYAAKAILSLPVWKGQFQIGTEETFTRRSDEYHILGIDIPASSAKVKEENYAGFASYGAQLPKIGQLSAGVRYEYVRYSYKDALDPANDLIRNYGNWFPTLSYAGAVGPVQLMLSYSARTRRPNYGNLSNAIRYNSRYIWQSGNARLQPEFSHNLSFTTIWKFITVSVNYARTDGTIMRWSEPYNEDGVVLIKTLNIDSPFRQMAAYVNLTPTIGVWTLNYTLGILPQWLSIDVKDPREPNGMRKAQFNDRPICLAQLFNTLTFKGGWQLEVGSVLMTPGYSQNILIKNWSCNITAAVQKTLLKDGSLVLRLEGADLIGMDFRNALSDLGNYTLYQTNLMDNQRVKLSLRYSFNTAQSKYRGTGAGSDSKSRM